MRVKTVGVWFNDPRRGWSENSKRSFKRRRGRRYCIEMIIHSKTIVFFIKTDPRFRCNSQ